MINRWNPHTEYRPERAAMRNMWRTLERLDIAKMPIQQATKRVDFIVYCNEYGWTEPVFEFFWQKWIYKIERFLDANIEESRACF